jgi:cation-dependent mannose-6-phosphate receptor
MRLFSLDTAVIALVLQGGISYAASSEAKPKPSPPCTAHSTTSGAFYDLRSISLGSEEAKKTTKTPRTESWHAKGYDYGANFTLNVCAPVLEEVKDVVGVKEDLWRNVSAYYEVDKKIYSIG